MGAAEAPGVFLRAMIIARVPLFFFQAVKASLLPSLADLAGRGDLAGFRNMQLKIVAAVSALALASVLAGSATAGVLLRLEYSARARSA